MAGREPADLKRYQVETCRQCRRALYDVRSLASRLTALLEEMNFCGRYRFRLAKAAGRKGKERDGLYHVVFRVSLSGCPNSCSQPQIKDFGVQGRMLPAVGPGDCISCLACEDVCAEGAVAVRDGGPGFDYGRCVSCGSCVGVCPSEAIRTAEKGLDVLVGGKLGRHPRLATVWRERVDEEGVLEALAVCAGYFLDAADPGERFGSLLARRGLDDLDRRAQGHRLRRMSANPAPGRAPLFLARSPHTGGGQPGYWQCV